MDTVPMPKRTTYEDSFILSPTFVHLFLNHLDAAMPKNITPQTYAQPLPAVPLKSWLS